MYIDDSQSLFEPLQILYRLKSKGLDRNYVGTFYPFIIVDKTYMYWNITHYVLLYFGSLNQSEAVRGRGRS